MKWFLTFPGIYPGFMIGHWIGRFAPLLGVTVMYVLVLSLTCGCYWGVAFLVVKLIRLCFGLRGPRLGPKPTAGT